MRLDNKTKKRILFLILTLLFVSITYAQECTTNQTPVIKTIPTLKLNEDEIFRYDVNLTNNLEDVVFSYVPFNMSIYNFKIEEDGKIFLKPTKTDAGTHTALVIATTSQGCFDTQKIRLEVYDRPDILNYTPENLEQKLIESNRLIFSVDAEPGNKGDKLYYEWYLDNRLTPVTADKYFFITNYSSTGFYRLKAVVKDSRELNSSITWTISVKDKNRPPYLKYPLPSLTIAKDTSGSIINVGNYIYDPDMEPVKYEVLFLDKYNPGYFKNGSNIMELWVNNFAELVVKIKVNLYQEEQIRIRATDLDNASALSNVFEIDIAEKLPTFAIFSQPVLSEACSPEVQCTEWSECLPTGIKTKECRDKKNCNKLDNVVIEYEDCDYNATCNDHIKNQNEEEVDCGGPCPPCPTCTDNIQNQGEEDIDCGGPCKVCPNCFDLVKNQDETDIDCGGICDSCPGGSKCKLHSDCQSLLCTEGICEAASCFDFRKNQGEERVDCGGPCEPCATCTDGIQNQGEEDIDCSGPCKPCMSCDDGIRNQGEWIRDCGGPCECKFLEVFKEKSVPIIISVLFLFFFIVFRVYISNHRIKFLIFASRITGFLPSKFVSLRENTDTVIGQLRQFQLNLSNVQSQNINTEFTEIMQGYFMSILEVESVSAGMLRKALKEKVKNPFVKKLVMIIYFRSKREVTQSPLFKIEMNQKIERTIALLKKIQKAAGR